MLLRSSVQCTALRCTNNKIPYYPRVRVVYELQGLEKGGGAAGGVVGVGGGGGPLAGESTRTDRAAIRPASVTALPDPTRPGLT